MPKILKLIASSNIITRPAHYVEGRTIEPIVVIEEYGLCHHLACVVKYISRAGRKTSFINDLKKAEWYLSREVIRLQQGMSSCIPPLNAKPTYSIQEILDDWELSANLSACLSYILDSWLLKDRFNSFLWISKLSSNQALSPTTHNADFLIRALGFLQSELSKQVVEEHS
ncbi:MAG: DUF3310 domain-containing protein [Candidatus Paracaedibacter sp.]